MQRFRRRHPRYLLVGRKAVGAALLAVDEFADADRYLANLRTTRRHVRRAARLGYTVGVFDPGQRRSELLSIHTSLPERQGRTIDSEYVDPGAGSPAGPNICDMFFGAGEGRRQFRAHLGFRHHFMRWKRKPQPPSPIAKT